MVNSPCCDGGGGGGPSGDAQSVNRQKSADEKKMQLKLKNLVVTIPEEEIERVEGRLPPTQVNLNFIRTLERIPGSIQAPEHPEFNLRELGNVLPPWYVDELHKRPFPIPDPKAPCLISSEPTDFSLEAQPKTYSRFQPQRVTVPKGFAEVLTVYSKEVVRYQVQGVEMTNLFSAIFFRELVRMRGISFRDQLKHSIELEELRKYRESLKQLKLYRGRMGSMVMTNAHMHPEFHILNTFQSASTSSSSTAGSSSSSGSPSPSPGGNGETAADDAADAEEGYGGGDDDADDEDEEEEEGEEEAEEDDGSPEGARRDSNREAVNKEFRDVLQAKDDAIDYDPAGEYKFPKMKVIVTPGEFKKDEDPNSIICTRETCGAATCRVCQREDCCGACEVGGAAKTPGKRCKKCGNPIRKPPTLEEQGICTPDTCGARLVCGDACCKKDKPKPCNPETCGAIVDCLGNLIPAPEEEDVGDESTWMGEHICKRDDCGNLLPPPPPESPPRPRCCDLCGKPEPTICDPKTCGETEAFTCADCRLGCCGQAPPKCSTCGAIGGGNRQCGDCGGGPGGPGEAPICNRATCGKDAFCVECCNKGARFCDATTCGTGCKTCKRCLKKRLMSADCTKKTCPVCSGKPTEDGKVPTCCPKCERKESVEDLDTKVSESAIPPGIKRLLTDRHEGGDSDTSLAMGDGKTGEGGDDGKGGVSGAKPGDIGGVIETYCVKGTCANQCGVCGGCSKNACGPNSNCNHGGKSGKTDVNKNRNNADNTVRVADNVNCSNCCGGGGGGGGEGGVSGGVLDRGGAPLARHLLADMNVATHCDPSSKPGPTCTINDCGRTKYCHKCHGGRDDKPEACPICNPPELVCGPGVCGIVVECGDCCETPPDFKASFPKIAYSGIGPFQLKVCGPIAGKIAAKKLGLKCAYPSPSIEERMDDRWFKPDDEAERRRLEAIRKKQILDAENVFTRERLFGRRFSGAICGVDQVLWDPANAPPPLDDEETPPPPPDKGAFYLSEGETTDECDIEPTVSMGEDSGTGEAPEDEGSAPPEQEVSEGAPSEGAAPEGEAAPPPEAGSVTAEEAPPPPPPPSPPEPEESAAESPAAEDADLAAEAPAEEAAPPEPEAPAEEAPAEEAPPAEE